MFINIEQKLQLSGSSPETNIFHKNDGMTLEDRDTAVGISTYLFYSMHATCPARLVLLDLIVLIKFDEEYSL
jgi:hypothetical protein